MSMGEMNLVKCRRNKKGLITKTLDRCRSIGRNNSSNIRRILNMPRRIGKRGAVATEGCFSVYVGPEKQRFVIKTEHANHPLFKLLLEEAESEYGYNSDGPLVLPCDVDVFYRVLVEMDCSDKNEEIAYQGCSFSAMTRSRNSSYQLLSPSRFRALNNF